MIDYNNIKNDIYYSIQNIGLITNENEQLFKLNNSNYYKI
jgi:hypothetical protein